MEQLEFRASLTNYLKMSDMLKKYSHEEILSAAAETAGISAEVLANHPMGGYSKGMTSGAYFFVLQDLQKNIEQYDWLYHRLEDERSRYVFANLIGYRVLPAQSFLEAAYDDTTSQYFDKTIVSCDENEVFVDCGGFTGDATEEFIRQFKAYRKVYVYEPFPDHIQTCRDNLAKYPDIIVRQCSVGERPENPAIKSSMASGTFMEQSHTKDDGGIRIVSLDEDIREPITFLKMDVEGFEVPALLGAKRHIREDFPKLAVCLHYIVSDMWEIPRLIDIIRPGYRFYIRHYDFPQNWETVLYAVPPRKSGRTGGQAVRKRKRVVALPVSGGWRNGDLVKDCGMIPYLLHKNHRCESIMVGSDMGEYPNLRYVGGLKLDFLPDDTINSKLDYLRRNAGNIDCLLLHGCYDAYISMATVYKQYNPQGKISMALDANSSWMDRIQWTNPHFQRMMDQCDVITASGRTMQRHLNEKWPWAIEYIPNGFYNFSSKPWEMEFEKKENIILTVSRLGTPQKAVDVLLESFAQIAEQIPDWCLRLAGGVDESFQEYLSQFWERFPGLRDRIHFLGAISDRDTLYQEYRRSKIFALPSAYEGGTPNVIAEALYAGNAVAVTKIDEYQDAIDNGRCGLAAEIGDVNGFAEILLRLCQSERLDGLCRRAYAYAQESFNMERNVARLYQMIFGVDGEI